MRVYTVHEPPRDERRDDDTLAHSARFVFVRDGFHFWAFLLAPLWMLRHRLWLEFIVYGLAAAGLFFALNRLGVSGAAAPTAFLLAILVGIEASSLRRWKLARRGYTNPGVVVAKDREDAERRFFDGWAEQPQRPAPAPASPPPPSPFGRPPSAPSSEIVGLFPQPDARP
jgi:hypothetical protein